MAQDDTPHMTAKRAETLCRERGLTLTVQRRAILAALASRSDHPTADALYAAVCETLPGVSRTTVYRALEALAQAGVARQVFHPGVSVRYEIAAPRHHHLVCLHCGKMEDLHEPALDHLSMPGPKSGFHISDYGVEYRGLCKRCWKKQKQGA
jgi:Fur family transcriptional regulator, peroxide stress response regulator